MAVYKGKVGLSDAEAQVIGEELEQLGGKFKPADIILAARPERSKLHKYFTWDDSEAAAKHRLYEARQLVERIKIVIQVSGGDKVHTRAFHSVLVKVEEEEELQPRYVPLRNIRQSKFMREQVLGQALKELNGWRNRYQQYRDVLSAELFDQIDRVLEKAE